MSRSIRGDKRAKRLCGRVTANQALTRSNKRYSVLPDLSDNQPTQSKQVYHVY